MIPTPIVVAQQCSIIAAGEAWTRGNTWSTPTVSMMLLGAVGTHLNNLYVLTKSHTFAFATKIRQDDGSWKVTADAEYDFQQGAYQHWQDAFAQIISRIDDETEVTLSADGVLLAGNVWSVAMTTKPRKEYALNEAEIAYETGHVSIEQLHEEAAKPKRKRITK